MIAGSVQAPSGVTRDGACAIQAAKHSQVLTQILSEIAISVNTSASLDVVYTDDPSCLICRYSTQKKAEYPYSRSRNARDTQSGNRSILLTSVERLEP